jgi:hypothetical protein
MLQTANINQFSIDSLVETFMSTSHSHSCVLGLHFAILHTAFFFGPDFVCGRFHFRPESAYSSVYQKRPLHPLHRTSMNRRLRKRLPPHPLTETQTLSASSKQLLTTNG